MEITIQKEIREICNNTQSLSNDILEAYIEYAALYSKECWLILLNEHLRRMENEISII